MPSLQIRAGSASSRRKRESSLLCKISTFSLVKAAGPNSWRKNPSGGVPVLELDDGSYLAESVAICHYFTIADITALVAIDIGGRLIHFFRLLLVFWWDHRHRTGFQSCWPIHGHSERGLQAAWSAPQHCPAQARPSPSEIPRIRTARTPGDSDSRHRRNCATGGGCGAVP